MLTFFAGLGLGLSLIVAIGAQNVFVLRQGLRREHVLLVVLICAISDAVLIAAGVAGLGAAVTAHPWVTTVARWGGAAFLLVYAGLAARRAFRSQGTALEANGHASDAERPAGTVPAMPASARAGAIGAGTVAATAFALTWLNPHVYLDTVLLLGSIGTSYGDDAWLFAAGAMTASAVWFSALGFGSRLLSSVLSSTRSWRILDGIIAIIMVVLAFALVIGG